jgi:hypothetical protein
MTVKVSHIRSLLCACCGGRTLGRQWWNQDTGYGVCERCADWIEKRHGREYVVDAYGEHGVHHSLGKKDE